MRQSSWVFELTVLCFICDDKEYYICFPMSYFCPRVNRSPMTCKSHQHQAAIKIAKWNIAPIRKVRTFYSIMSICVVSINYIFFTHYWSEFCSTEALKNLILLPYGRYIFRLCIYQSTCLPMSSVLLYRLMPDHPRHQRYYKWITVLLPNAVK